MRDEKVLESAPDSGETSGLSSEETARPRGKRHADRDSVPNWAPFAVLGVLVSLGLLGGLGAIPLPGVAVSPSASAASVTPLKTSGPAGARAATSGVPAPSSSADAERIGVSHIVVAHKGVQLGAHLRLTRTREEAKQRALEALARARKGEDFGKLVAEYSDEPGSAARKGSAGRFGRKHALPGFSEAAFALKVGGISDVVESSLGFHVILRTE
jgi:hypothetical protein